MGFFDGSYKTARSGARLPRIETEGDGVVAIDAIRMVQGGQSGQENFFVVEGRVETFPGLSAGKRVCVALIGLTGKFGSRVGEIRDFMDALLGRASGPEDAEAAVGPEQPHKGRRIGITVYKRRGKQDPSKTYYLANYSHVDGMTTMAALPEEATPPPPATAAPEVPWHPLANDPRGNQYRMVNGQYEFRTV